MLRQLAIRNVVLVERLELEFEPGLGVLTGETGAGKSILLDALGLALGARADSGAGPRRAGRGGGLAPRSSLPPAHPALALLAEQGIEAEPGEPLIIRRTLKSDGGSRAFVGGASVPAGLLRDLGALAVEIHGQHDDRGLLNPKGHRALLDAFGRLDIGAGRARPGREVTRIEAELAEARADAAAAERDREWLEHACAEIEALAPEEGEETRLAEERAAMQAGAEGRRIADRPRRAARRVGRRARPACGRRRGGSSAARPIIRLLAEALAALDRAVIEASEAEDRIARAAEALAFDPARLEQVEARLFDIRGARPQASRRARRAGGARRSRCASNSPRSRPAASGSPNSTRQLVAAREAYAAAADDAERAAARRRRAARRGGRGRACAAQARRGALPHRASPRPSRARRAPTASSSKSRPIPARRSGR